jgi:hypothetical protein
MRVLCPCTARPPDTRTFISSCSCSLLFSMSAPDNNVLSMSTCGQASRDSRRVRVMQWSYRVRVMQWSYHDAVVISCACDAVVISCACDAVVISCACDAVVISCACDAVVISCACDAVVISCACDAVSRNRVTQSRHVSRCTCHMSYNGGRPRCCLQREHRLQQQALQDVSRAS